MGIYCAIQQLAWIIVQSLPHRLCTLNSPKDRLKVQNTDFKCRQDRFKYDYYSNKSGIENSIASRTNTP